MYQSHATSPNATVAPRCPEHPFPFERRPGAIGSARHLAGGLGQGRAAGVPRVHRRVEVLLIPELRTERILLVQVHVVEALGRMVARVFHDGMVGTPHIRKAAGASRLHTSGLGVGDLRLRPAEHAARARPRVAADEDRIAAVPGVEWRQLDV
jgi:hypothetical protein